MVAPFHLQGNPRSPMAFCRAGEVGAFRCAQRQRNSALIANDGGASWSLADYPRESQASRRPAACEPPPVDGSALALKPAVASDAPAYATEVLPSTLRISWKSDVW